MSDRIDPPFISDEDDARCHRCAWETCFACRGAGVELGMEGDVATCQQCRGACVLRRRDSQGRFTDA